jgi:hypothetical protein
MVTNLGLEKITMGSTDCPMALPSFGWFLKLRSGVIEIFPVRGFGDWLGGENAPRADNHLGNDKIAIRRFDLRKIRPIIAQLV